MIRVRLSLIFIVFYTFLFAQKEKQVPLLEVLNSIEKTYNIKFSFSEDIIKNKLIKVDNEDSLLAVLIQQIEKKTGLKIKKINDRYYTIASNTDNIKISGYIFDENSKDPLLDAAVFTKEKGVGTDEKGYFELKGLHEKDTITFSFVGYENIQKTVAELKKENSIKVYLKESSQTLNEIIISSYLTTGIAKNTDGSILLTPRKQGVLPGLTEADVLLSTQQLPGIQSPIESASGIHIRGGTPDQNLILFDGIKLYNTSHFFGSISAFNPYVVDNVSVYKNASNAKYGNHIAGVIDIKTMNKVPEKFSVGAGFNFTSADVNTTIPISDKLGVQFSFRRSIADVFNTPTFDKLSQKVFQNTIISDGSRMVEERSFIEDQNEFSFIDFNTKVVYQPNENNTFSLQQISIKNDLSYILDNKNEREVRSDFIDIENDGYGFTWKKKWSETVESTSQIYYSKYKLFYDGNKTQDDSVFDFTLKKNNIEEVDFYTQVSKKIGDLSTIKLGYQFTHSDISYSLEQENTVVPTSVQDSDDNINNQQTVLLEYILKKGKKVNISAGLRASYMPLLNKTFFEPRIYGRVQVNSGLWLNASAELKKQYTSRINEFFTTEFDLENQLWTISNGREVPLLESQQFTTGLLFNKGGWLIDFEAYYKNINGITSLVTGFNNEEGETVFNGMAQVLGAEILVKKEWSPYTNTLLTYAFGDNKSTFSGVNEGGTFDGAFSISNAIYIAQQITLGKWNFSLGWNVRAGLPFDEIIAGDPDEQEFIRDEIGERNGKFLPVYHRLDASATYDFFWDKKQKIKSRIGISFINLYDRRNILRRTFEKSKDTFIDGYDTVDTFSLGFTPNVVFRVQF